MLTTIALTCVTLEAGSWWWARKINEHTRRIEQQYRQALQLRHGQETKSVLIVGNSSLRYGLDSNALESQLGQGYEAHVLEVDATTYPDWYFGLKQLFRKGAQPDYVVVLLPAMHMPQSFPPPENSAYYLIAADDVPSLARDEHLSLSLQSDVFVQHFSAFFARRSSFSNGVKRRLFPGFEKMAQTYMVRRSHPDFSVVTHRMQALKTLCDANGTRLLYVIPPTNQPDDTEGAPKVLALVREAGVPAALPVPNTSLTDSYYIDGYHLNDAGRRIFTNRLATYLLGQFAGPSSTEVPIVAQSAKN